MLRLDRSSSAPLSTRNEHDSGGKGHRGDGGCGADACVEPVEVVNASDDSLWRRSRPPASVGRVRSRRRSVRDFRPDRPVGCRVAPGAKRPCAGRESRRGARSRRLHGPHLSAWATGTESAATTPTSNKSETDLGNLGRRNV